MNRMLVYIALETRQPVSEVMSWDGDVMHTAIAWLEEKAEDEKQAGKGR